MAAGLFLKFDASNHFAVIVVFVVGATLVLPIARTPLLKL